MRRLGIVVLGAAAVFAGWLARPRAQPADAPFVIAPGPEAPGAVRKGAADVKAAQALGRKKKLVEAVALLERVAAAHPAATHDCNLALAYLRAGQLTRAQLMWDVSRQRGKAPPEWCESTLAGQLATALRDGGYVPLTLLVSPAGAEIEVAGTRLRDLGLVWLPAGTHTVRASAAGMEPQSLTLAIALPSARAAITLEPPRPPADAAEPTPPEPPEPIDAAPAAVPIDAPSGAEPIDAAPLLPTEPPAPRWPAFAGVGVGGVGVGVGLAFHLRALKTKDRANEEIAGTPAFDDQRDRFGRERAVAITGYAIGAAGLGFATWYWLRHKDEPRYMLSAGPAPGGGGAMLTVGGVVP